MIMASVMQVHLPRLNILHKHFAFVAQEIDLQKVINLLYDGELREATAHKQLSAGVYGFRNKETRDRFISMLNGASDLEIAYIASINPATGPVA